MYWRHFLRDYPYYKDKVNEVIYKLRIECQKEEKEQDKKEIYELYKDLEACCQYGFYFDERFKEYYKQYTDYIKEVALNRVTDDKKRAKMWRDLYWDVMKLESFWYFESYLIYMEHKRPFEKKFYEPRAKTLKMVVNDLQIMEDSDTQKMLTVSMPSRTGKSTIMVFFLSWVVLRHPFSHNALATHSNTLAKHFYKEILDIFTTNDYCFKELFTFFQSEHKCKGIVNQSAEDLSIFFETEGDFPTCCFRGCDSTWTGAIDITPDGYLFIDDLVRDRAHSLSQKRMDETFSEYLNKMVDRKNEGAKEIMIGTLWNVMDPIMRLEEMYKDNPDYVFRRIPALDENDESNFDYDIKGFSTQYYRDMREKLIKAGNEPEWMAKFQQKPYKREGILFAPEDLRFFNGVLPQEHSFTFITVCDVALGGGDSVSMPIGLQDNDTNWIYIIDWYFNSSGVKVTIPGISDMLMRYGIKEITFEKNNGGQLFAMQVQEELQKRNYICSCNTKPAPNYISKEDKIKGYEGKIKAMIIFLDTTRYTEEQKAEYREKGIEVYQRSPQYERAMNELSMFTSIGKTEHDDAPDSIAQLCAKAFGDLNSVSEVELFDRRALGF